MPELLSRVTQEEYDRLSVEYLETVGRKDSAQYYAFFANVQKEVEKALTKKFKAMGIKMIRQVSEEDNSKRPAMRYKLVFEADPTATHVLTKLLNMTQIIREIRLVDPKISTMVPDVKIVNPQYLTSKVDEVTDQTIAKFQSMFRERAAAIEQKLSKEGLYYANPSDHALVGNKQGNQSK